MTMIEDYGRGAFIRALSITRPESVCDWACGNVRLIGSARSETFDPRITPWTREPIECVHDGTRSMTFIKPVQSGGSVVGEIAICYWITHASSGDIAYYWPTDEKADDRWDKRVERILKACPGVGDRIAALEKGKSKRGLINFAHMNLAMLGANTQRNVESDSYRFIICEEVHDDANKRGWTPGRLQQAHNRATAFDWNSVILNISNAGEKDGQLHKAFDAGTQQHWEVRCPGCGDYHRMRARWEDDKANLGGLRYDADLCRVDSGEVNYTKLMPTIRYQMPCGAVVRDDVSERRSLSLSGRYSAGDNPGAVPGCRSFTLEAVSVDYIPWLQLIQEKHRALRALKYGDAKPWLDYLRERECRFARLDDRPVVHRIILSDRRKDRAGLLDRVARFGALDRQQGSIQAGELPHWWGLVQDVAVEPDGKIHVLTVWEGKLLTDEEAADVMKRHGVKPACVVVDSGWDAMHVYQFCLQHGFSAIKGSDDRTFPHPTDEGEMVHRIYSVEKPLHSMLNMGPTRDDAMDEPVFWHYSKFGIMDRLAWLRSTPMVNYEVPADASQDFIAHMDSWTRGTRKKGTSKEEIPQWVQHRVRDDLYFCACYVAMLMEMAGIIGLGAIDEKQ